MPKPCFNTMNRPAYLLGVEGPGLLGSKVTMIPSGVSRPIPDLHEMAPQAFPDARDINASNAVRLHGGMKPKFFEGTAVASEATRGLATT